MTPAVRACATIRRFGAIQAVDGLDLAVPTGVVSGFLGPNGAGKTTTLRMVLGLIRPDAGEVGLFGTALAQQREGLLGRVGALVERPSLYDDLSGRENLEVTRRILGVARVHIDRVLAIVDLADAAHRRAGEYSQGMRQRLGLAIAMLGEPELLILDEPTNGLDPAGIQEMRDLLRRLPQEEGVSVFLSSHLLAEVEQVASHLVILHRGPCLFQGPPEDLQAAELTGPEGRGRVIVGVERPRDAAAALVQAGWRSEVVPDETAGPESLRVDARGRDARSEICRVLVEAGYSVHRLEEAMSSLESVFLDLTEDPVGEAS